MDRGSDKGAAMALEREVEPVGFHILHIDGSIGRLLTYAGAPLRAGQTNLPREETKIRGIP